MAFVMFIVALCSILMCLGEETIKHEAVEVGAAQYVCDPDTGERSFE